jgi:phospholipid-transporting ATPase
MENSLKGRAKKSKMELATNHYIILIVSIQISICLLSAAYNCLWVNVNGKNLTYLGFNYTENTDSNFQSYIIAFMQWFLALMNFVSISLLVTLEMVKFFQGYFIE